jgi:hypothetical protein
MIMKANAKIIILIPYITNKWPVYFKLFLKSCEKNRLIDVFLLSNIQPGCELPPNVYHVNWDLEDFSNRLERLTGMKVNLTNPYFLNDYRPLFGSIFKDLAEGYQYWGYGDIDLIYGNLQKFIGPLITEQYDVISFRQELQSGSLSIFRNSERLNQLILNNTEYINALASDVDVYKGLDETAFDHSTWKNGLKSALPRQSLTYYIANLSENGIIKSSFQSWNREIVFKNEWIHYKIGNFFINGN